MALFIRQDEQRTELQQRLAAELREKAKAKAKLAADANDIESSRYLEGTKKTTTLAGPWAVIVIAALIIFGWYVIMFAR